MKAGLNASHLDALDRFVETVSLAAHAAAGVALDSVEQSVRARAAATPGWQDLAEHIVANLADGVLELGVPLEFASEAADLEFGGPDRPPVPLFRKLGRDLHQAQGKADEFLRTNYAGVVR